MVQWQVMNYNHQMHTACSYTVGNFLEALGWEGGDIRGQSLDFWKQHWPSQVASRSEFFLLLKPSCCIALNLECPL